MVLKGLGLDASPTTSSLGLLRPLALQEFYGVVYVYHLTNPHGVIDTDAERNPEQERIADAFSNPYSHINGHHDENELFNAQLVRLPEQNVDFNTHTGVSDYARYCFAAPTFSSFCSLTLLKTRT